MSKSLRTDAALLRFLEIPWSRQDIGHGPNGDDYIIVMFDGTTEVAEISLRDVIAKRKSLRDVCGRYERAMEEIDRLANNGALNLAESQSLEDLLEEWRRES